MRKHAVLVAFLGLFLALSACGEDLAERAVAYNDAIVAIQTEAVGKFDAFVDVADTGDSAAAIAALNSALDSVALCIKKLEAMEAFEGSTALRDATKQLMNHYLIGLDKEFRSIIGVIINHNSTLEQLEAANEVRDRFSDEEDRLFKVVEDAQKKFSEQYQFKFEGQ